MVWAAGKFAQQELEDRRTYTKSQEGLRAEEQEKREAYSAQQDEVHLARLKKDGVLNVEQESQLRQLIARRATSKMLRKLTEKYDLLPLGGSDYHGIFGNDERLPGDIPLPNSSVDRLLELGRTLPNKELVP